MCRYKVRLTLLCNVCWYMCCFCANSHVFSHYQLVNSANDNNGLVHFAFLTYKCNVSNVMSFLAPTSKVNRTRHIATCDSSCWLHFTCLRLKVHYWPHVQRYSKTGSLHLICPLLSISRLPTSYLQCDLIWVNRGVLMCT